ncbi:FtsK/SpoIIIE domain-containing protein [Streptomyces sp. B-S-A8]|uniref:FtsK/SpoIIIE domain-containing protein n=1 Tax=Streptomyces solicavernae TaxID=3043614 RepID=A0ABT6S2F2_9ACTN|nr:FtsK/SpoIIIE domain-containing protein [Streptomyces sp. B-S-A8]MDI3390173.1 FtsK/SpoIIIE domain-containing protein [Streptomyces sp. B-S-A8]
MAQPSTTAEKKEWPPLVAAGFYGVGVAIIAIAAARLLNIPQLATYGLAVALAVLLIGGGAGYLVDRRARPVRNLHAALLPKFGPEFQRDAIKVGKYRSGRPTRVVIEYPSVFNEREEKARKEVRDIIAARLGGAGDATWDTVRRRLVVTLDNVAATPLIHDSDSPTTDVLDDTPSRAATRDRATGVLQNVLGATAKVDVEFHDDGDGDSEHLPVGVTVRYPATRHDVSPRFRQAVLTQVDSKVDNETGAWRDIWDLKNNVVKFQPRPAFPRNAPYPLDRPLQKNALPYAVNENEVQEWVLGSRHPHKLVVGPTGSGKTVLIRNLAISAAMQGIPVVLCDPKRIEYRELATFPGILLVTRIQDISYAILQASDLMHERYNLIEAGLVEEGTFNKILVIVDEFIIFKDLVNKEWKAGFAEDETGKPKPRKGEDPSIDALSNMGYLARSADVHLVIGMQRPDAAILTGPLRDQLRKRTALDQHSVETAKMMWGDGRMGTTLPSIQGRGLSETGSGPEEIQVLRCLPPGTKGHNTHDAVMWEEVTRRASDPALWQDVELPPFFEELEERRLNAIEAIKARYGGQQLPGVSMDKPALDAAPEPDDVVEEPAAPAPGVADEPQSTLEQVSPYELQAGDQIMVEDDTGIPEIVEVTDIHFGAEDGEETITVDYDSTENSTKGVLHLDPDTDVDRCG